MFYTFAGDSLCDVMAHFRQGGRKCPYADYYLRQAQSGGGISQFYAGAPYQRGYGLGGFLKGLFRSVVPLFRSAASAVGKEALKAGSNVLVDTVAKRVPFKQALRSQWETSSSELATKARDNVQRMVGSGRIRKTNRTRAGQSVRNKRVGRTTRRQPAKPKRKAPAKRRKAPTRQPAKRRRVSFVKQDIFD